MGPRDGLRDRTSRPREFLAKAGGGPRIPVNVQLNEAERSISGTNRGRHAQGRAGRRVRVEQEVSA